MIHRVVSRLNAFELGQDSSGPMGRDSS